MNNTFHYTSKTTCNVSFYLALAIYVLVLLIAVAFAHLLLATVGVPLLMIVALRVAFFIMHGLNIQYFQEKFFNPLVTKVSTAVEYTKTKFIAASAWVKTLFKKAEVAPEAAAA